MTVSRRQAIVAFMIAGSMLCSSAETVAGPSPAPRPSAWVVLSAMSGGAPAAALCGATTSAQTAGGCVLPQVAAGPAATPAPIPAAVESPAGVDMTPLLVALAVVAGGVALFFVLRDHHGHHPNSPA